MEICNSVASLTFNDNAKFCGRKFAQIVTMKYKIVWYLAFFAVLVAAFWFFVFKDRNLSQSNLAVINNIEDFSFVNQDGKNITDKDVDGKVYVAEYFFTTCQGICPKMNAN